MVLKAGLDMNHIRCPGKADTFNFDLLTLKLPDILRDICMSIYEWLDIRVIEPLSTPLRAQRLI